MRDNIFSNWQTGAYYSSASALSVGSSLIVSNNLYDNCSVGLAGEFNGSPVYYGFTLHDKWNACGTEIGSNGWYNFMRKASNLSPRVFFDTAEPT